MVSNASADGRGLSVPIAPPTATGSLGSSGPAPCRQRQAEQVLDLAGEDDDGDAGGEADGHRIGDELDVGAEPQEADRGRRMRPAIIVARISPSMPCRSTVAATSTMKAPAGPPIWKRLPPSAETRKPPTIAV
jgi:hypothetical protein